MVRMCSGCGPWECAEMAPVKGCRVHRNGSDGKKLRIFILWIEEPNFGKAIRYSNGYPEQKRNVVSFIFQKTHMRVHFN